MTQTFPIEALKKKATPYYYYNIELLRQTLDAVKAEVSKHDNYFVHYAIKANANPVVLKPIMKAGLGIDCVSGGEITASLKAGFPADKIVFAGVGKADWEIEMGIDNNIFCFNVESIPELEVINEIAQRKGKVVNICLRINPNVGAHTHANITTGLSENKFGIDMAHMFDVIKMANEMSNVSFQGLHFHIGSQILEMDDFIALCHRVNELQDKLDAQGIKVKIINVGGGLGVDYDDPIGNPLPPLKEYFDVYNTHLKLRAGQELHFELGRAIVAQCGSLITKVLYMKDNTNKKFAIVDAGFTELIRPALYGAHHKIMNLTSNGPQDTYDVVGPICESSDTFDTDIKLNEVRRGDLIAMLSAGAYGEAMASCYNCRKLPKGYSSEDIMAE
ncbi:MAG: diaminopimelate decarboxylase [Bacteroidaceae bacterium]|nr:diaminopimelate decarboxylase [Bacteroidaceae bacterium]